MRRLEDKIIVRERIWDLSVRLRSQGKRIISTNGCFDILHCGHIQYLDQARRLGDVLVVLINSDASVKKLKGEKRPVQNERARSLQVAALEAVDFVVIFKEETPVAILEQLKPSIHVKGGDYVAEDLPERAIVEKNGGEVCVLPLVPGFSTTHLLEQFP